MQRFTKSDKYQANGDFIAALSNEPERIALRWEQYQGHIKHHATTIAARLNNGVSVSDDEKAKIVKHQRALISPSNAPLMVSNDILQAANSTPISIAPIAAAKEIKVEVVEVVNKKLNEDMWESLAQENDAWMDEQQAKAPSEATNPNCYKVYENRELSDYYRQQHESRQQVEKVNASAPKSEDEARAMIAAFTKGGFKAPGMSDEEREALKATERENRKIAHWNNLLSSGLPSVIAEVERQVLAAGYVITDNQVGEPEF